MRIDAAYAKMGPRVGYGLDLLGLALLGVCTIFVTWRAALPVQVTWVNGSRAIAPLQTPLILPRSVWAAGRADAFQHRRLHAVRGDLGGVHCHRGDGRHRPAT